MLRCLTREYCFYNRFGQFIYSEPAGKFAGYDVPQFSIHRGDLQMALLEAFVARAGGDKVITGARCTRVDPDSRHGLFRGTTEPVARQPRRQRRRHSFGAAQAVLSDEGPPKYSGINMWRGVTRWKPILSGASMVRVGWHHPAKLLIYPIRNNVDARRPPAHQLGGRHRNADLRERDWNKRGDLDDFIHVLEDWKFDWLDVPAFIRASDSCWNIRWSIRTRCRAGASAASRCSAMPRIRCIRAAPMARRRRSSIAGRLPMRWPRSPMSRARSEGLRSQAPPGHSAMSCSPTAARRPMRSCTKCTSAPATSRSRTSMT